MKSLRLFIAISLGLAIGCGSAVPKEVKEGETADGKRIASGDEAKIVYDAPPQKFVPRTHPPRQRHMPIARVDTGAMPSLKLNLSECFNIR